MIFFLNLNGTCTRQDTDHIYQGSNGAAKVIAITGISPAQSHLQVAFTLPNGLTVGYLPMQSKGAYQVGADEQAQAYVYELDLPYNVTEVQGTVGVSFNVVNSITGANMTSYTNTFEVEYSALPLPPSSATESEIEQILNLLEAYVAENSSITEKVKNFHVGTVTAQASQPGAEPQVTAEIVSESMPNGYALNMDFTLPRGEDGITPDISINASVDDSIGTPSVEVTKKGTPEAPEFDFEFHNLKGNNVMPDGNYPQMSVGNATNAQNDGAGKNIAEQFDTIDSYIPSATNAENQLADKAFVNSSINNMAAFYITSNAQGDAFATRASLLNATAYYYGGQERTPTQNDYAIVLADESQPKGVDGSYPTTRYSYQGTEWSFQYVVNNTALTQAQVDAINSGITKELVDTLSKGSVLGVKGNSESEYRTGNVNLTAENIGAAAESGIYPDLVAGRLKGIEIPDYADFNDLIPEKTEQFTIYVCPTMDRSNTLLNTPFQNFNTTFYMTVVKTWVGSNKYYRVIRTLYTTRGEIYIQTIDYTSGDNPQWADWVLIPSLSYLQSNFSNPNLLINGNFAINQRGQTSMTGTDRSSFYTYFVDRWCIATDTTNTGFKATLNSDGSITIDNTQGTTRIIYTQYMEYDSGILGKQLTASFTKDGTRYAHTFTTPKSRPSAFTTVFDINIETTFRFVYDNGNGIQTFAYQFYVPVGRSITVKNCKLEIGAIATDFVPPNPATELVKCQRYYKRITTQSNSDYQSFGLCYAEYANRFRYLVPCEMYKIPTLIYEGDFRITSPSNANNKVTKIVRWTVAASLGVLLDLTVESDVALRETGNLQTNNDLTAYIALDAEI